LRAPRFLAGAISGFPVLEGLAWVRLPATRFTAGLDEILPEYDFRYAKRNKYAASYESDSVVVVLDPHVAK
jgi:hypothetical protein